MAAALSETAGPARSTAPSEVISVIASAGPGAGQGVDGGGHPSPTLLHRFTHTPENEEDIDELDNLVSARDKLELYNMLALEKDIIIDKSCPRESAIGRIYPARWLSAHVDVACLEIDPEHLNIRQHALGGLINTALSLRKVVSKINHHYSTSHTAKAPGKSSAPRHAEEIRHLSSPSPRKTKTGSGTASESSSSSSGGSAGSNFRAHIQELVAMQLEPHLKIITSAMPNCTSVHQLIKAGQAHWSWAEKMNMLLQVSQGLSALHSYGVNHGNLRLTNLYLNPVMKRVVICATGWDRLLPPDILNIHQADDPGSIRWTAPECYQYITNLTARSSTSSPSAAQTEPTTAQAPNTLRNHHGRLIAVSPRRLRPHPPGHRVACDVFAFAVTMWELAQCTGQLPYNELRYTREVIAFVQAGKRMLMPPTWPLDLRELITLCWTGEFTRRPTFGTITEALTCIMLQQGNNQTAQ